MPDIRDAEKPIIGVVPLIDKEKDSYWMLPGYMTGLEEAGGLPVMLPLTSRGDDIARLMRTCAGFLFTGGQDVSPELYGEKPLDVCGDNAVQRDEMELELLRQALEADKPLLGICRGLQFINAALGGKLYQDLPTQKPSGVLHAQKPPYDKPIHSVAIVENTPLFDLLECNEISVNSCHHQGIKELSGRLEVMAFSRDGLAEAVYMQGKSFVWAVQWHPEFSYQTDENSKRIFRAFVRVCREKE